MTPKIAAVVLAAGRSTRMAPANKLLALMPDGRPMIAHTVDNALASGARPVIVVVGNDAAKIGAVLDGKPVELIYAQDYTKGLSASLRCGLGILPELAAGALICLGDMPLVDAATLKDIIAAFNPAAGRNIIVPTHRGRRGNPVLWARHFIPKLRALDGDTGGRQMLQTYADSVFEVPVGTDSVLRDFDSPEVLATLAK